MDNILKITEKVNFSYKEKGRKNLIFIGLIQVLAWPLSLFILAIRDDEKIIDSIQNNYLSLIIMILVFGFMYILTYIPEPSGRAIIMDDQYLYMTSGPATLWHVEIMQLTSISIDTYPLRWNSFKQPPMIRLKTSNDCYSFIAGGFEQSDIDLVIKRIQQQNPVFYKEESPQCDWCGLLISRILDSDFHSRNPWRGETMSNSAQPDQETVVSTNTAPDASESLTPHCY